ncbi:hypothetical protein AB6A40_004348 [Gnathostoma spinigerum]|uniref:RING-type domain-containing protein n=1 Tax=Gnathostoma spinigerum TaxID=75299 RepID=A0ABD6EC73_9BILA
MFSSAFRCPICAILLTPDKTAALKCGHVFHSFCILRWLELSKSCPLCRRAMSEAEVVTRLYFGESFYDESDRSVIEDDITKKIQSAQVQLRYEERKLRKITKDLEACQQEKNNLLWISAIAGFIILPFFLRRLSDGQ